MDGYAQGCFAFVDISDQRVGRKRSGGGLVEADAGGRCYRREGNVYGRQRSKAAWSLPGSPGHHRARHAEKNTARQVIDG